MVEIIRYSNPYQTGLNPSIKVNNFGRTNYFGIEGYGDKFQNSSPTLLFDERVINNAIKQNPQILSLLNKNNIPLNLNMEELNYLKENHCKDTMEIASMIYKNLPLALRLQVNLKDLKDGAILHDFGKVLIPKEILTKNGSLTPKEHNIMDLHSELGYQILKTTNVTEEVLKLVKHHHSNDLPDINLQILNLADKYSALTEKRVYKEKLTSKQALTILYKEVQEGKIDPILFNSLVQGLSKTKTNALMY